MIIGPDQRSSFMMDYNEALRVLPISLTNNEPYRWLIGWLRNIMEVSPFNNRTVTVIFIIMLD